MAEHKKAPTVAEALAKSRARRKAREAEKAREKTAAESKAAAPVATTSTGLIDRIRKAFSSEENVSRIESALDAVGEGIKDADADTKRKKK